MAQQVIDPIGITYKYRDGNHEYQLFPEEYFSGADIHLYFGDIWNEEVISLSFALIEQVKPIYGYASYTFDFISRGARLVQGQFSMAFKSVGYLFDLMDHIGMVTSDKTQAIPKMAYDLGNVNAPDWLKDAKGNINDILGTSRAVYRNDLGMAMPTRADIPSYTNVTYDIESQIWGREFQPSIEDTRKRSPYFNSRSNAIKLDQRGFDIYIVYIRN